MEEKYIIMPGVKAAALISGLLLSLSATASATPTVITFDTDQSGNALVHGQSVDAIFDFADATPEFDFGVGDDVVRISTIGISPQTLPPTEDEDGHLGAAIFNSNLSDTNDGDLEVGLGNILILQEEEGNPNDNTPTDMLRLEPGVGPLIDHDDLVTVLDGGVDIGQRAFAGTLTGGFVFDTPDDTGADFIDPPVGNLQISGATIVFEFRDEVELISIDLVDADDGATAVLTLIDANDNERVYAVEDEFSFDITDRGLPNDAQGFDTLFLNTLLDQTGEGGGVASVFSEDLGFDPTAVVQLDVSFGGSSGLDNLTFIPEPGSLTLLGLAGLALLRRR